ncbi:CCA tRNA nucleotidyltransferase [Paenibacillaceae bacterium WGS1546]|uniref:CCA tRNA nucleotidyltransferase n=1 Tax=Cohnella sp. WGS1546 TaxID=3366810 RepID=UPI00372D7913
MQDEDRKLWEEGLSVARKLESAGHRAYLVGGCVRDKLLGRPLGDIDIATSAKPGEVVALFPRTLPTGLRHGTVTVREAGRSFEVTTFRTEAGYSDARRPDEVAFVDDVREDLARRDFTFNAMAWGSDGELVDPFGGRDALRAGVVACVGDASERFGEDALRMLRAIRFAAEFDFELLPDVWEAIVEHRAKLRRVSIERVGAEWDKMMAGSGPEQACHYLFKSGLLAYAKEPLPEPVLGGAERYRLNGLPREWARWGGTGFADRLHGHLLALPWLADPDLRWAALLYGMGASEAEGRASLLTLRLGGRRASRVADIVGVLSRVVTSDGAPAEKESWIASAVAFGLDAAWDALAILEAAEGDSGVADRQRQWIAEMPVSALAELNVAGDELVHATGLPPGPWIARTLRRLLEAAALGNLPNEKSALLAAAKTVIESEVRER